MSWWPASLPPSDHTPPVKFLFWPGHKFHHPRQAPGPHRLGFAQNGGGTFLLGAAAAQMVAGKNPPTLQAAHILLAESSLSPVVADSSLRRSRSRESH